MTSPLARARDRQQATIEARFGTLRRAHLRLEANVRFFNDVVQSADRDRMGEVILALRRPDGEVLLHTKTFYPNDLYRLPSGGIQGDEPVIASAEREAAEETGLDLEDARPLGLITYDLVDGKNHADFHSWVVTARVTGEARPADPHERIEGYRWVPVDRLPQVADDLRSAPPEWASWGHFRALAHDLIPRWIEEVENG